MHLGIFITTVTFLLAQFASLQSIALSSIGVYSLMRSSLPPTLPTSAASPRVNSRTSTHKFNGEIVTGTVNPRPASNSPPTSPSSAGSSEPRALSSVFPLSDMRSDIEPSIPSTSSANNLLSLNVSPRSTNDGDQRKGEGTSSSPHPRMRQSSNTRRGRKAKEEEELRQANRHPAQDRNVGSSSGSNNVDSFKSNTLAHAAQNAVVTDTQQQESRVHHSEALSDSFNFSTAARKQQLQNSFPTCDRTTTDHDGPSNSLLYNSHPLPINQTSLSPNYNTVYMPDNRQPPTSPNGLHSHQQVGYNEAMSGGTQRVVTHKDFINTYQTPEKDAHNRALADMDIDHRRLSPDTGEGSIPKDFKGKGKAIEATKYVSINDMRTTSLAPGSPQQNPHTERPIKGLPAGSSFRKNNPATTSASIPVHHSESSSHSPSSQPIPQTERPIKGIPAGLKFLKNNPATTSASIPVHHSESFSHSPSTSQIHASVSGSNSTSQPSPQHHKLSAVTKATPSLPAFLPPIFAGNGPDITMASTRRQCTPAPEDPMVQDSKSENIEQPPAIVLDIHEAVTSPSNVIIDNHSDQTQTLNTMEGTSEPDNDEWDLVASKKDPVVLVVDDEGLDEMPSGPLPVSASNDTYADDVLPTIPPSSPRHEPPPSPRHQPSSSGSNEPTLGSSPQNLPSKAQLSSIPSAGMAGDAVDPIASPSSSNANARAPTPPKQSSDVDFLYEEQMQSVERSRPPAVISAPQWDLPAVAAAILAQEVPPLVHDESTGAGPQENQGASQVSSLPNPNVASNRGWYDFDASLLPPLPPSPLDNTTFVPLPIEDTSMMDASHLYDDDHPLASAESTGTVGMEVEPPILLGIVDTPMAAADADEGEMAVEDPIDELSLGLEGIVLPKDPARDASPDTEMSSEDLDAGHNDAHMGINTAALSTATPVFADVPAALLMNFAAQQRVNASTAGGSAVPASQRAVKGTGPPQRGKKAKPAVPTIEILPGVGFVPSYPNGVAFRLESAFHWPMDTTPDREFIRPGQYSTDESMDWTSTDSSDSDIEMEDLTCPAPLIFSTPPQANVSAAHLTEPTLEERHCAPVPPTPLVVLPAVSLTISITPPSPGVLPAQVQASVDKPAEAAPAIPVEEPKDTAPSNPKTAGEEAPSAAEPSAEEPAPKPREVHAPPPDVRTSGGGAYSSLGGGYRLPLPRPAAQWNRLLQLTSYPVTCRLRGRTPDSSPCTPDEFRAHLNPRSNRITPPPRATPQRAAADPTLSLEPSQAPGHAAFITTVRPVAPGPKYTRECHFPVPHAASHSAVTTPSERTAARPHHHRRSSSAATTERAAARGRVPHIPEEDDQEWHSSVIDTHLGKKAKKARKSRKEGETRRSKKKQQVVAALPEVLVNAPPVDPLTHATRWGVEKDSVVGLWYGEVSAAHKWLSHNPWYMIEWYLIMLALVSAFGNRFFVTALLMSLCVDPWFVYLRHGVSIPVSASASLVVSTAVGIRDAVVRIRRFVGDLPLIGRLIR